MDLNFIAVFILAGRPQKTNYHIIDRTNTENQTPGHSGTHCEN